MALLAVRTASRVGELLILSLLDFVDQIILSGRHLTFSMEDLVLVLNLVRFWEEGLKLVPASPSLELRRLQRIFFGKKKKFIHSSSPS